MAPSTTEYTLEQVAKHNTEADCWIVVDGIVLAVSSYLDDHPGGGDMIVDVAGTDCSEEFHDTGHSIMAIEELVEHQIGVLKKTRVASKRTSKRASKRASNSNASKTESKRSSNRRSSGKKTEQKSAPKSASVGEEAENPILKAVVDVWTQLAGVDWKGHVDGIVKSLSAKN